MPAGAPTSAGVVTAAERAHLQRAWDEKLAAAEAMVPLIGRLYRRDDVVPSVHGRPLVGQSPIGIGRDEPGDPHRARHDGTVVGVRGPR